MSSAVIASSKMAIYTPQKPFPTAIELIFQGISVAIDILPFQSACLLSTLLNRRGPET